MWEDFESHLGYNMKEKKDPKMVRNVSGWIYVYKQNGQVGKVELVCLRDECEGGTWIKGLAMEKPRNSKVIWYPCPRQTASTDQEISREVAHCAL